MSVERKHGLAHERRRIAVALIERHVLGVVVVTGGTMVCAARGERGDEAKEEGRAFHAVLPRHICMALSAASTSPVAPTTSETANASGENGQMPSASSAAIRFCAGVAYISALPLGPIAPDTPFVVGPPMNAVT